MEEGNFIELRHNGVLVPAKTFLDLERVKPHEIDEVLRLRSVEFSGLLTGEVHLCFHTAVLESKGTVSEGKVILTSFRLVFVSSQHEYSVQAPLGLISKFERPPKKLGTVLVHRRLSRQILKVKFGKEEQADELFKFGTLYLFNEKMKKNYFAYSHAKASLKEGVKVRTEGWLNFSFEHQFAGLGYQQNLLVIRNTTLCQEYPDFVAVPFVPKEELIQKIEKLLPDIITELESPQRKIQERAQLRVKCRFPVVVYANPDEAAFLLQCSHPAKLITADKLLDQPSIYYLIKFSKERQPPAYVHIVEQGSPPLFKQLCKRIQLKTVSFPAISTLNTSLARICEAFATQSPEDYFVAIEESGWLQGVLSLIQVANTIAKQFIGKGRSVVVDCPTGCDRSTQVLALVQLLVQPDFRTQFGFQRLIQKQFVQMGHPFTARHGSNGSNEEQAPVFLQFLQCVQQLVHLFPLHFEFNFRFLSELALLSYSNMFGNFLFNRAKEYALFEAQFQTLSVWKFMSGRAEFVNPFYRGQRAILSPVLSIRTARVFVELFDRVNNGQITVSREPVKEEVLAAEHSKLKRLLQERG